MKKLFSWPLLTIIATFTIGFFLRFYNWSGILFTYDQARDAFEAISIAQGNLKLVGPPTDIPGVFHGPAYYYFLAPLYLISNNTPFAPLLGVIFVNLASGGLFYLLARRMFNSDKLGLLGAFLFSISTEAINYGRWLSNPTMVVFSFLLFLYGLWILVEHKPHGWILVAIGAGLSIQFQLFMLYLIPTTFLFILVFKPPIQKIIFPIIIFIAILSTFIISEIKFEFQGTKGLFDFFSGQSGSVNMIYRINNYLSSLTSLTKNNFFPQNTLIAQLLLLSIILMSFNKSTLTKFLWFIFLTHALVFLVSKVTLTFISVGMVFPLILALINVSKRTFLFSLIMPIIIVANFLFWLNHPQSIFEVQPGMNYVDELRVIKKTYEIADGPNFSINTVTNPYRYPTLWAYLYTINNQKMPNYRGLTMYSFVGKDKLIFSDENLPYKILIAEPKVGENDHFVYEELKRDYPDGKFNKTIIGDLVIYHN